MCDDDNNSVGLFSLVKPFDKCGTFLHEDHKFKESQHYFQMSIEICENKSNLSGYADLLDDMNDYDKSVSFYWKAIAVDDEPPSMSMIPHYNLGQTILSKLFDKIKKSNYCSIVGNNMIEILFISAVEQFHVVFNNERTNRRHLCINTLNACINDILPILPDINHYYNKAGYNERKNHCTELEMHSKLEKILEIIYSTNYQQPDLHDNMYTTFNRFVTSWKNSIEKMSHYIIYKNKKNLFEKMNYFDDCCICLEKCLHIDLHCGHTVCTDCYKKIYEEPCPMCRSKCEIVD